MSATRRNVLKLGMLGGSAVLLGANGGAALAGVPASSGESTSTTASTLAVKNTPVPYTAGPRR
jgi:hypothetical protein